MMLDTKSTKMFHSDPIIGREASFHCLISCLLTGFNKTDAFNRALSTDYSEASLFPHTNNLSIPPSILLFFPADKRTKT